MFEMYSEVSIFRGQYIFQAFRLKYILTSELRLPVWDIQSTIVPVIIEVLAFIPPNLKTYIKNIGIKTGVLSLQEYALLHSANVLRKRLCA